MAAAEVPETEEDSEINFKSLHYAKIDKKQWENYANRNITSIILDDNDLTKLENLAIFSDKLTNLSAANNNLPRMYGVAALRYLTTLNLSNNFLVCIEALKDIPNLKWLNLSRNNIKIIQNLSSSTNLQHLDISENRLTNIADISSLTKLHTLLLHGNKFSSLKNIGKYFPQNICILSFANNAIVDLNEMSHLSGLCNLTQLSVMNNPCVIMTDQQLGFDYRPFIVNWCFTLEYLDGYVVGDKESLKAEWLYSQGKGRHFTTGQHAELAQYLSSCCPLTSEILETEEDTRLNRVLRKQKQHKKQLQEERSLSSMTASTPSILESTQSHTQNTSPYSSMSKSIGPYSLESTKDLEAHQLWSPVKLVRDSPNRVENDLKVEDFSESDMSKSLDHQSMFASPSRLSRSNKRPRSISSSEDTVRNLNSSQMVRNPEVRAFPVKAAQVRKISPRPLSCVLNGKTKLPNYIGSQDHHSITIGTHIPKYSPHGATKARHKEVNKDVNNRTYSHEKASHIRLLAVKKQQEMKKSGKILNTDPDNLGSSYVIKTEQKAKSSPSCDMNGFSKKYDSCDVKSIVKVQALWRGQWVRNYSPKTTKLLQDLCVQRMQKKIQLLNNSVHKLTDQMTYEQEQRELQSRLISSLWNELKSVNEKLDQLQSTGKLQVADDSHSSESKCVGAAGSSSGFNSHSEDARLNEVTAISDHNQNELHTEYSNNVELEHRPHLKADEENSIDPEAQIVSSSIKIVDDKKIDYSADIQSESPSQSSSQCDVQMGETNASE